MSADTRSRSAAPAQTARRPAAAAGGLFSHTSAGRNGIITIRPDQPYAVIEVITPERAERILAEAEEGTETLRQRPLKRGVINEVRGWMQRGEWRPVPPGIVYDTDHRLINGRHRLSVQVEKGLTLSWWVTYNCAPETFALLDTHAKRTIADALYMTGAVSGSGKGGHLGSALKLITLYERRLRALSDGDAAALSGWGEWPKDREMGSNAQMLTALQDHPLAGESLVVGYRVRSGPGLMRCNIAGVTGWHRMLLDMYDGQDEQALAFAEQVTHGHGLNRGDPADTLRKWILKGMPVRPAPNHRLMREATLFAFITAWNAHARHEQLREMHVSWRKPMPVPVAWRRPRSGSAGSGGRA